MTSTETAGSGDIPKSLELLWGTGERPTRGPKPGLTLDRIVTAAVAVADAEGIAAVSMRRLSTELGTGTMSLYRYVPGKAELLDLMLDRVQSEPFAAYDAGGAAPPADWRVAIEGMARGYYALLHAHPWLLHVNETRTVLGPSAVRGLEVALAGLRGMGLRDPEKISVIITVNNWAFGMARMEILAARAAEETGMSDEAFYAAQESVLSQAMTSGAYPLMAAMDEDTFSRDFDHFAFGLRRLVEGFETLVAARTEAGSAETAAAPPTE